MHPLFSFSLHRLSGIKWNEINSFAKNQISTPLPIGKNTFTNLLPSMSLMTKQEQAFKKLSQSE